MRMHVDFGDVDAQRKFEVYVESYVAYDKFQDKISSFSLEQ